MDLLLLFYSVLLAFLIVAPFIYVQISEKNPISEEETRSSLESERKMLLENLKDLKTDMDTKKIQTNEFSELSKQIIEDLKQIDTKLANLPKIEFKPGVCRKCNFHTTIPNAKFCAMCGSSLV
ncbi:MAG TPA: hypothetical protein PKD50_08990 [Leptospiraceae bacterium]|nr:hypothetical protein [Leptospiraceae bacterium]